MKKKIVATNIFMPIKSRSKISGRCSKSYIRRRGYKAGSKKRVPSRCIRSTSRSSVKREVWEKQYLQKKRSSQSRASRLTSKVTCPSGTVKRIAHMKRSTTGKEFAVPAACITDRGNKGKRTSLPPLKSGTLSQFGYSTFHTTAERHKALTDATKKLGYYSPYRKLIAVAIRLKNTSPDRTVILRADATWMKNNLFEKNKSK